MLPLILLSLMGLLNTFYLHWQYMREKNLGKKMICLMGSDCFNVIDSKYGKTFGIKNEIYGFVFYSYLLIYSIFALIYPKIEIFTPFVFVITLVGALFSIYLFIVQSLILKKYCSWCLIAILINIIIFGYMLF